MMDDEKYAKTRRRKQLMAKRIAIIEDDKDYREVLTEVLKKEGYDVYGAESGFDIIDKMVGEKPDLEEAG